jgi:hypothetical protein
VITGLVLEIEKLSYGLLGKKQIVNKELKWKSVAVRRKYLGDKENATRRKGGVSGAGL